MFDQMLSYILQALAWFVWGIRWEIVAILVTAAATVALVHVTRALSHETRRMRKRSDRIHEWNVKAFEESRRPIFILYTAMDEESGYHIVLDNISQNSAYDVSIMFGYVTLDSEAEDAFHDKMELPIELELWSLEKIPVMSPGQKIFRYYQEGIPDDLYDGSTSKREIVADISYTTIGGLFETDRVPLDSFKMLYGEPQTGSALITQLDDKLKRAAINEGWSPGLSLERYMRGGKGVVAGVLPPPRIPRPVRDSLRSTKLQRSSS